MEVPPPMGTGIPFYRPEEVELCYQATCKGDVNEVKKLAQRLFHDPRPLSEPQKPHPAWIFKSLAIAIQERNIEIVRILLEENVADGNFLAPAEIAVRARACEVLELLLQYGWDINQPSRRNEPPLLSIPAGDSDREMVEWLLDHGADPNARCAWDFTPMSDAVYLGSLEIIDYLFTRGADVRCGELLQWAVHRKTPDALDVVRRLVERGAPFNEVKYAHEPNVYWEREPLGLGTPLHRAAELGQAGIVEYLLEQGADPLKLDSKGKTPRFLAQQRNHIGLARILLEAELCPSSMRFCSPETSNVSHGKSKAHWWGS